MTKKDYVLIAEELKSRLPETGNRDGMMAAGFEMAVCAVANALAKDSPRFDEVMFVNYVFGKCKFGATKTN